MNRKKLILLCFLILPLALCPATRAGQFTVLHEFTAMDASAYTNNDGALPYTSLLLWNSQLYGTANSGGLYGNGALFRINPDGSGFTNFYNFSGSDDGAYPVADLVTDDAHLYGVTQWGTPDAAAHAVIYRINPDGSGFTNLHTLDDATEGSSPSAGLALSSNALYGTTYQGGAFDSGTIFRVNPDGSSFTNLHDFGGGTDGINPFDNLVVDGRTIYGTTFAGGDSGKGMIFRMDTDGSNYASLYSFNGSDGANPFGSLLLVGNTLYGTAFSGGTGVNGTIFSLQTDGTGFTTLHAFDNTDGAGPDSGLTLQGDVLYGTTSGGGASGKGTIFQINLDGSHFTNLFSFNDTNGASPQYRLVIQNEVLYGTTTAGGSADSGVIFAFNLSPTAAITNPLLTIIAGDGSITLAWPAAASGFTLQTATNLTLPDWNNITDGISLSGTNYLYTQSLGGHEHYFRLAHP